MFLFRKTFSTSGRVGLDLLELPTWHRLQTAVELTLYWRANKQLEMISFFSIL